MLQRSGLGWGRGGGGEIILPEVGGTLVSDTSLVKYGKELGEGSTFGEYHHATGRAEHAAFIEFW